MWWMWHLFQMPIRPSSRSGSMSSCSASISVENATKTTLHPRNFHMDTWYHKNDGLLKKDISFQIMAILGLHVSFQGYKMAQGWWISAIFSSVEKKSILRLSSMVGLWLDYCSKNVDFFHDQTTWLQERWCNHRTKLCPLVGSGILVPWIILKTSHFVWFSKDFPGSIIQQTPTLNAFMLFLLFLPRVYNNTSNTFNIFLGRCYTHGCVAITIFIGLLGTPSFHESAAVLVFPRWSSRGLKSTSSLHACLQWPRRQW